ncbi:hypothetical protein L873DRAFT_1320218 [Choiromyces venosus 120613-1]|uniref:Uncharacterized protein n=1 Tax=Choiromyces venosus 120613-1 TaxID=1336337 RepID=A0A3N4JB33_9PEZI|nr:hypothetical protein L873DRAFT_1320218 [Choiromyces venosus 120613-1]
MENQNQKSALLADIECLITDETLLLIAGDEVSECLVTGIIRNWSSEVARQVLQPLGFFSHERSVAGDSQAVAPTNPVSNASIPTEGLGSYESDIPMSDGLILNPFPSGSTQRSSGISETEGEVIATVEAATNEDLQTIDAVNPITNLLDLGLQQKRGTQDRVVKSSLWAKRIRKSYLPCPLPDTLLTKICILHSNGKFKYLEERELSVDNDWNSNEAYAILKLNDNENDYLDNLAYNCLKPQTLLLVMELLVQISHHKISGQPEQPSHVSLVPALLIEGASLLEQDMIPRVLATTQRAHEYIMKYSFDAYEARLHLMLAYITLHVTLECIITPFLIKENSEMNTRQIKGLKWKFYFEKLGGEKGLGCKLQKLKDNVGYGKILWTWVTDCGIVWLPTLASLDHAITIFIKANPLNSMHSKVVGNKLATQEIWAAFLKAMAPVVLNLLFSITSPPFTMSDLLRLYFHQPQINQSATRFREVVISSNYNEILYTMADQEPNLILFKDCIKGTIFESLDIEPTQTPTICYPPTQVTKVNLIN